MMNAVVMKQTKLSQNMHFFQTKIPSNLCNEMKKSQFTANSLKTSDDATKLHHIGNKRNSELTVQKARLIIETFRKYTIETLWTFESLQQFVLFLVSQMQSTFYQQNQT